MEVIIQPTPENATLVAADLIASLVRTKPACTLGLATGSTPVRLYAELIRRHREDGLNFSRVSAFNLDEYVGLPGDHPASYARFMEDNLFGQINLPSPHRHIPSGVAANIPAECAAYEQSIADAGGIDLQLLGLGTDGHIGFNEPGSSLNSRTRLKTLTQRTREDNARFFASIDDVPHHVITMGLGTIMESRTCVLLAFGNTKANAVRSVVEGPVTASVPGSILQFHPTAHLIVDEAAAAALTRSDYYKFVYANKPTWQRPSK